MKIYIKYILTLIFILTTPCLASEKEKMSEKIIKDILSTAVRAPSGHNTQPWTVTIVGPCRWIIGWEKTRSLPGVDGENRELMLSIGAFSEAIGISARANGFNTECRVITGNNFSDGLLELRFTESESSSEYIDALKNRRTVRKGLLNKTVSNDIKHKIIRGSSNNIYFYDRGSEQAKLIEKAVLDSNRIQAYREAAQRELASWIRWTDSEAVAFKNGLTAEGMEIGGLAGWYVKHFYSKEDVLSKKFREQSIELVSDYLKSYGTWIIIESEGTKPEDLISAGVDFLRIGLNSYYEKIALHPMTQPLEEDNYSEKLRNDLGIKGNIQFIVRAGFVENYPAPVTLRMSPDRIILNRENR